MCFALIASKESEEKRQNEIRDHVFSEELRRFW